MLQFQPYGVNGPLGQYNVANIIFATSNDKRPGRLGGTFKDNRVSPEVTLAWHPTAQSTIYVAYKTGFKSGGFGISSGLTASSTIGDFDFDSETVKGVEFGAKGTLLNGNLRVSANAFAYNFKNLQVNIFDPGTLAYTINNAGGMRQRGLELEASYQPSSIIQLRGGIAYIHNRFRNFTGQCYGYTIPAAQAQTASAPKNCSFVLNPNGSRKLTGAGAPILQQVFDGRAPARSPTWSGNAGLVFSQPVGGSMTAELTGDAMYSSSYEASETMSPSSHQPSFWHFNASMKLKRDGDLWYITAIARNLTNKYYLLYGTDRTGGASVPLVVGEQRGVVARGRELAVQVGMKF